MVESDTRELQTLVSDLHLSDIHYSGSFMTWCNKRSGDARMYCKLDKVMCNEEWIQLQPLSNVNFMNFGTSDHVPRLLVFRDGENVKPRPFKYCDIWSSHQQFIDIVAQQ